MANLDDHYRCRDELTEYVVRDLIGPLAGQAPTEAEKRLTEAPYQRYLAGVLYPQSVQPMDPAEDNDPIDIESDRPGEDNEPERTVPLSSARYPSAIGLTCAIDPTEHAELTIEISAARYEPETNPDGGQVWRRIAIDGSLAIDLRATGTTRHAVATGLEAYVKARAAGHDGATAVTVALVNTLRKRSGRERDTESFFQAQFALTTTGGRGFVDRSKAGEGAADDDGRSLALLYLNAPSFAVGHGTGVEWGEAIATKDGGLRVDRIWTTPAPSHDLRLADSNPDIVNDCFSMQRLATADRDEIVIGLSDFVAGYEEWIDTRRREAEGLPGRHRATAARHLDDCAEAARRMRGGIDHLVAEEDAWRAFRLANQAMLDQRVRSQWVRDGRTDEPPVVSDEHRWRPFQLGFILMTLRGVADRESDERSLVDLLWFPTGGGKTEAYLGLIAYTIFLRRLRGVADGGTGGGLTVIMRYTLRLLTLQQFERAAMLICACERLRRQAPDTFGAEQISLCLWVGGAATPNQLDEARHAIGEARKGRPVPQGNPVQLTTCPWCAEPLSARNYRVTPDRGMVISCPSQSCDFADGLPCYLVDEDVYRIKPTLMIATVDKFASLPWRDSIGDLFNIDSAEPPPELIIQDELHLISGPLGTMVGLYETAIDMLCVDDDRRPKLIASTATIRRAADQVHRLYDRSAFQFPPPGIDATDSYFAVEAGPAEKGTRRYLGLMAPGRSLATLLVHVYAALLQRAAEIDGPPPVIDPYWTLLGYFNNLRVLGAANMQVRDAVRERTDALAGASGAPGRFADAAPVLDELTSRADASRIPEVLRRLASTNQNRDCLDVVLATNMISVGLDIDRLGLMVVAGQPQSASEYVQATSRVGRRHPGLVVVLYNAFRSRDRSHYEDFVAFHNSIYRQVDASSLTPFAGRARDRGLHAILIGMLRATHRQYRSNDGAADVSRLETHAAPIIDRIVQRIEHIDPAKARAARAHLEGVVAAWKQRAEDEPELFFRHQDPRRSLLTDAAHPELAAEHNSFSTMWSMRSVDTQSNLHLIR